MSNLLKAVRGNWTPSKNLVAAIRDVYLGNTDKLDLNNVSAEDWRQANSQSDAFENLYQKPTKDNAIKIIDLNLILDIEDICSFGNISFVLWDWRNLTINVNYIIENNIKFNEVFSKETTGSETTCVPLNFQDILSPVSELYFENWQRDDSIEAGGVLVNLCDHLGVKIETIAESPSEWDIEEFEFANYAKTADDKKILKSFARLFNKPMSQWYPKDEWWN